ncbi:MAG: SAM-dependent methyltransferase, partial [Streptosporangiaceae bacterium]|nr:SAM-dependent methyltransferase [Streptosporangiaceae bacterium]
MNADPAVYAGPTALLSAEGQELLARIAAAGEKPGGLALGARLRREYPAALVAAAQAQHELRLAARAKFGRAMEMLFTRDGLEQASSEMIARHRARRFGGAGRTADLCCGIGGDLTALAAGREVLAVDRYEVHARLAVHNAGVYGAGAWVRACVADVRDVRLGGLDAVFADPARRTAGNRETGNRETGPRETGPRRFRAGLTEPPMDWCLALTGQAPAVGIKAAPGLPLNIVPAGWEAEFIADGRDLKEAMLWSPALATAARRATILPAGDTLVPEPGPDVPVGAPGEYLLDPNPAVTRAGLVAELARRLGARQIDPMIAFLATDRETRTPFARTLRVLESAPWNEKHFARRLRELGIGAADLRRRGLAGDVDRIRRRLKLAGPNRATVVLTRVSGKPWGLICT